MIGTSTIAAVTQWVFTGQCRWSPKHSALSVLGFVAFTGVFRHHHTRSDKGSGSLPAPFIPRQQIHPHFLARLTTNIYSFLSCQVLFFFFPGWFGPERANVLKPTHHHLFLMFPALNSVSFLSSSQISRKNKATLKMQHRKQIKKNKPKNQNQ